MKKHGITRNGDGITSHGLRHAHLHKMYENIAGRKTSSAGGTLHKTDKELDTYARCFRASRASRESIASVYLGGKKIN